MSGVSYSDPHCICNRHVTLIVQHSDESRFGGPEIGNSLSMYSGNLTLQNPSFLKIAFQMVRFSKGLAVALAIAMAPTIHKPAHLKSGHLVWISNGFWLNRGHLSGFQMVRLCSSNGWASGFQIISKMSFSPIKI